MPEGCCVVVRVLEFSGIQNSAAIGNKATQRPDAEFIARSLLKIGHFPEVLSM
jgi:hypothetical protein